MPRSRKETSFDIRNLVIKYHEGDDNGQKTQQQIAALLKIPRTTVQYIIKKYKSSGLIINKQGRGRKPIFSVKEKRAIVRKVAANPKLTISKIKVQVENETGKTANRKTIANVLKSRGFKSCRARKKPLISKANLKKRLAFAKEHVNKNQNFWDSILWSDESKYNIFGSDGRARVWRKSGEALQMRNLNPTVKHGGGSVMIWGCFSSAGTGNHEFVDGIMNQHMYQGILDRNVKQSATKLCLGRRYIFQQDRDPKHTAKTTWEFFKKNKIKVLEWPPQSPDLNPIEHLWDHIERTIRKSEISSKQSLKTAISDAFQTVTPEVTRKLVESMGRRCQAVISARGGPTRY